MFKNTPAFSSFSVDDMSKAKKFYGDVLGVETAETSEGLQLKLIGGHTIFIYPKQNHSPATFTVINFSVDDIEKAVDGLSKKGVVMEQYDIPPYIKTDAKGIARGEEGPRAMAWCKDPAGNIIGIMQEK